MSEEEDFETVREVTDWARHPGGKPRPMFEAAHVALARIESRIHAPTQQVERADDDARFLATQVDILSRQLQEDTGRTPEEVARLVHAALNAMEGE